MPHEYFEVLDEPTQEDLDKRHEDIAKQLMAGYKGLAGVVVVTVKAQQGEHTPGEAELTSSSTEQQSLIAAATILRAMLGRPDEQSPPMRSLLELAKKILDMLAGVSDTEEDHREVH